MLLAFRLQEECRGHSNEVKPNSHDFPTFQFNHHELYEYVQMFSDTFNICKAHVSYRAPQKVAVFGSSSCDFGNATEKANADVVPIHLFG
jgi:hypothetical protein